MSPSTEAKVVAGNGPRRQVLLGRQDARRPALRAPPEGDRTALAHELLHRLPPLLRPVVTAAEPSEAEAAGREVNVGPLDDGGRVRREREPQPGLVQLAVGQGAWARSAGNFGRRSSGD